MSEWLFDLGNSRLKFAPLLDDDGVGEMAGIAHDGHALAEGWASLLPARIDAAHVASVAAPALRVQRCYRDADGRVLMVAISLHPPGRFAYSMVLARNRR